MEVVASELWKRQPDDPDNWNNLAFSIRRKDSIKAAQTLLLEALEKFPNDAMTRYNLGCYACKLGDLEDAKKKWWVKRSRWIPNSNCWHSTIKT